MELIRVHELRVRRGKYIKATGEEEILSEATSRKWWHLFTQVAFYTPQFDKELIRAQELR